MSKNKWFITIASVLSLDVLLILTPAHIVLKPPPSIGTPAATIRIEEVNEDVRQLIIDAAKQHKIDSDKFLSLAMCESSLDPSVQSRLHYTKDHPKWGVKKGDRELSFGLFQIHLPDNPDISKDEALDPHFAVEWAAIKFKNDPTIWLTCHSK